MPVHIQSPKVPALPPPSALFGSSLFEHPPPSVYSAVPRRNSLFDHSCSNDITPLSRPLYILPPPTSSSSPSSTTNAPTVAATATPSTTTNTTTNITSTSSSSPPPPSTAYHHYPNNGLLLYAQDSPASAKQHQLHRYSADKRESEKVQQQHQHQLHPLRHRYHQHHYPHQKSTKRRRFMTQDNDQDAVNAAAATLASFATAHQAPFDSICCGDGGDKECAGRGNLACDQCQTRFQHARCLQRHRWEHAEGWKEIQCQLGMSKRQQVQLMEASHPFLSPLSHYLLFF
ncbi:hypothetical protein BX666DRAFT_1320728 [Dichotomocladium elegans]|nr:hypothetical protein BX666DRAFT_1320728 [Dichotomocladium elegans]